MAKSDMINYEGKVVELLPGARFIVEITLGNGNIANIRCYLSGKIRTNNINILLGDRVNIEMSPYDMTQGRITYRNK
jgi:translation initiation factor IF-1